MTRSRSTELIADLRSFHCDQRKSIGMLGLRDRASFYAQFAADHDYGPADFIEFIRNQPRTGAEILEWVCTICAKGCVHAAASFGDGVQHLQTIFHDGELGTYYRDEAFAILRANPNDLDLSEIAWTPLLELVDNPNSAKGIRWKAAALLITHERIEAFPAIRSLIEERSDASLSNRVKLKLITDMTALEDLSLLDMLVDYSFSGWKHVRVAATCALDELEDRLSGAEPIARHLADNAGMPFNESNTI